MSQPFRNRNPSTIEQTKLEAENFLKAGAGQNLKVTTLRMSRCFPEPAPLMAAYRLHRGIDARDVAEAHRLALINPGETYRMFILSGATPFKRADCNALKLSPEMVLRERCPSICRLFESRKWNFPDSIDRIYDSSLANDELGWTSSYGFEEVARLFDARIPEVLPEQAAESAISE
jgi:nucleoside-diphosphate-sugar epimerase